MPLPKDKVKEVLFHSMSATWRSEITMQGFNYPSHTIMDLIQFCERLESLDPKASTIMSNNEKPSKHKGPGKQKETRNTRCNSHITTTKSTAKTTGTTKPTIPNSAF